MNVYRVNLDVYENVCDANKTIFGPKHSLPYLNHTLLSFFVTQLK